MHSGQYLSTEIGIGSEAAAPSSREYRSDFDSGENKEMGGSGYEAVRKPIIRKTAPGFRSENVRMEGWQPASLRPARNEDTEQVSDATPRYQLLDQPPSDGVPVLHAPGQLRGSARHQRQKSSY